METPVEVNYPSFHVESEHKLSHHRHHHHDHDHFDHHHHYPHPHNIIIIVLSNHQIKKTITTQGAGGVRGP